MVSRRAGARLRPQASPHLPRHAVQGFASPGFAQRHAPLPPGVALPLDASRSRRDALGCCRSGPHDTTGTQNLGVENTRATTVEMTETPVSENEGVIWRDRLRALRAVAIGGSAIEAPRCRRGELRRRHRGRTPTCVNPDALVVA